MMDQQTLQKITTSKSLGRSKTYGILLEYLVRKTQAGETVKEYTIAQEVFNKPDFDPSQSTLVRVHMYNLRKKLNHYYKHEGRDEQLLIEIPKGSYEIKFVERSHGAHKGDTKVILPERWRPLVWTGTALLMLSLFINVFLALDRRSRAGDLHKGLWKDLYESDRSCVVVLGDLFIYQEADPELSNGRSIRDPNVNSLEELEEFQRDFPRQKVAITPLTYGLLIRSSVVWIKQLTEIFRSIEKDFTIRTISRFNPKELQDHDFIVIGMVKTLGLFNSYFNDSHFRISQNAELSYVDTAGITHTYRPHGDPDTYHTDYGIMAKFPGPNNNNIYYFGGLWDTGTSQSLKNFTDLNLLQSLEEAMKTKFGSLPKYYEVLFEVDGIDRMEVNSKILIMHALEE